MLTDAELSQLRATVRVPRPLSEVSLHSMGPVQPANAKQDIPDVAAGGAVLLVLALLVGGWAFHHLDLVLFAGWEIGSLLVGAVSAIGLPTLVWAWWISTLINQHDREVKEAKARDEERNRLLAQLVKAQAEAKRQAAPLFRKN